MTVVDSPEAEDLTLSVSCAHRVQIRTNPTQGVTTNVFFPPFVVHAPWNLETVAVTCLKKAEGSAKISTFCNACLRRFGLMWSPALSKTTPIGRRLYLFGRRAEIEFSSRWFTPYTDTVGLAGTTDSGRPSCCVVFISSLHIIVINVVQSRLSES